MSLVFKSELAQAHAEKAEDDPPTRAGEAQSDLAWCPTQTIAANCKKTAFHPVRAYKPGVTPVTLEVV